MSTPASLLGTGAAPLATPVTQTSAAAEQRTRLHAAQTVLPNLDGIRALACILVVLSHMPWPVHFETLGEVGVGVFFVLSGFLMGHLYAAAPFNRESVLRYGIARFSRIAPIYWLVIAVCVLISLLEPESNFMLRIEGTGSVLRHFLFAGNVLIFWSIPLEVQYYLFFVLVWWAIAASKHRVYALPLLALVCAALLLTHNEWRGLMLPHKLHFFLAGTLAGLLPRAQWQSGLQMRWLSLLQLASLAVLVWPLWMIDTKPAFYASTALGVAMAVAVYLLSLPSPWTRWALAAPWVRSIGRGSFSIYLLHVLVFHYGTRLLGLQHEVYEPLWLLLGAAGVALPMLVSRTIEMPLQRYTRQKLEARFLHRSSADVRQESR